MKLAGVGFTKMLRPVFIINGDVDYHRIAATIISLCRDECACARLRSTTALATIYH